jgi:hypothetical protein
MVNKELKKDSMVERTKQKEKITFECLQMWRMFKTIALKLHKLGSSCYPCLLALTPYDFNVLNNYRVQKNTTFEKKKK